MGDECIEMTYEMLIRIEVNLGARLLKQSIGRNLMERVNGLKPATECEGHSPTVNPDTSTRRVAKYTVTLREKTVVSSKSASTWLAHHLHIGNYFTYHMISRISLNPKKSTNYSEEQTDLALLEFANEIESN